MAMTLVATLGDKVVKRRGLSVVTYYSVRCACGHVNEFNALAWASRPLPCAKCRHHIDKRTMEVSGR